MPRTYAPNPNSLAARFAAQPGEALEGARALPLELIDPNPSQSRQSFDEGALAELAASITAQGVLQPILVRPQGDRWQVVAGERRLRAARLAGLTHVPAIIREMTAEEAAYATAVENLQREDLGIEDEARQFAALLTLTGLSQRALAEQLGIQFNYLSRRVRLLERPDLLPYVQSGEVPLLRAMDLISTGELYPPPAQELYLRDTRDAPVAGPERESEEVRATPTEDRRSAPDPPRQSLSRAALDQDTGYQGTPERGPALIATPYRARAVNGAVTTLLRMDWSSVPAPERAVVLGQIELLERGLQEARAALTEE